MLIRSPEALAALTLFHLDKTILYIEDAMGVGIYDNFIRENFQEVSNKIVIKPAFNKENVKRVYKILQEQNKLDKTLYIVDLDYERYLRKEKIENQRFIYLKKYTLENYMLSEENFKRILMKKNSETLEEVSKKVDYQGWISKVESIYRELVPLFLTIQSIADDKVENSGANVGVFFKNGECELCEKQMRIYHKKICSIISNNIELYEYYKNKVKNDSNIEIAIPGKQLLTLFRYELNKVIRKQIKQDDDLKIMLSSYLETEFKELLEKLFRENL